MQILFVVNTYKFGLVLFVEFVLVRKINTTFALLFYLFGATNASK